MGGNALKRTHTRRYNKVEYFMAASVIIPALESCFPAYKFVVIPAYKEKETFGDMDILYCPKVGNPSAKLSPNLIHDNFNPNEVVVNGSCMSFDQNELQIDLIYSQTEEFDYGLGYFSGSDCGNLVGKVARRFGLKHGHDGLFLPIRDGDYLVAELPLTKDIDKTYEFLGMDAARARNGFDNLDDIFDFVASSPYYDPDCYKLENLSHTAKVRDRKRETYRKFLEFGEKYDKPVIGMNPDKKVYVGQVIKFFGVHEEFSEVMQKFALARAAKAIFSGEVVRELTGLDGKELGEFMRKLKSIPEFQPEMVVYLGEQRVRNIIMQEFGKTL